ncbi:MAG: hypothetical protein GXP18_07315 [Gammaproteobacteria bacterium]|nr:hypothetical protein [Gammaproteobacteria bacterium]
MIGTLAVAAFSLFVAITVQHIHYIVLGSITDPGCGCHYIHRVDHRNGHGIVSLLTCLHGKQWLYRRQYNRDNQQ